MRDPNPAESLPPPAPGAPAAVRDFDSMLEREHHLQSSTDGYLDSLKGPHASVIDRILRNQHLRLGDNIALLEQRYERSPAHPAFAAAGPAPIRLARAKRPNGEADSIGQLPLLVAQHQRAIETIDRLIAQATEGQRELILAQVARNHREMAAILIELLRAGESASDAPPQPVLAAVRSTPGIAVGSWQNDGGAFRPSPAARPPTSRRAT